MFNFSKAKRLNLFLKVFTQVEFYRNSCNVVKTFHFDEIFQRKFCFILGKKSSTSMNPSLPRPNIIHQHHLLHQHHHHDEHDSSSVGSGGNDSLGSGHHSPSSEMTRSESALELRGPRKNTLPTLSASQVQKSVFRKSMPMHLEDSDGNNADDDSVNSFISSSIHTNMDEIPTRDIGPERPSFTFSQVSFFQRF